jgi:demethylmenaquinone methyltransferase/2-methoxy-6-polyprenyl-1,4-benzoquinol methylase
MKPLRTHSATKPSPLPPADQKAAYVQEMFNRIARRYDRMNRIMTFGHDRAWRRIAVAQLGLGLPLPDSEPAVSSPRAGPTPTTHQPRRAVLDLATGTGDLGLEILRQEPDVRVIGLDFAPGMLRLARRKADSLGYGTENHGRLSFGLTAGDALRLPFADSTFDGVVTGFALRNVTDIPAAFAEMARVTRPGGRVACLEIAKPQLPLFRQLFGFYFYRLVPLLGSLIGGERAAYTYLPHSLTAFLTPGEIVEVMRHAGWQDVRYQRLMLGTVAVHLGVRTGHGLANNSEK